MKKLLTLLAILPFSYIFGACLNMNNISVTELNKIASENSNKIVIIDVRSPDEYNTKHANGAINIPAFEYTNNSWTKIDGFTKSIDSAYRNSGKSLYIMCQSGGRSAKAVSALHNADWSKEEVINVSGGFSAWDAKKLKTE